MNKIFSASNKFWNWLVVSSSNPNEVAATVKGMAGLLITFLIVFLPSIGVQVNPDLSTIPDVIYSLVVSVLGIVSSIVFIMGLLRKIVNTISSK
jgi:Na+/pantothenate symporter